MKIITYNFLVSPTIEKIKIVIYVCPPQIKTCQYNDYALNAKLNHHRPFGL